MTSGVRSHQCGRTLVLSRVFSIQPGSSCLTIITMRARTRPHKKKESSFADFGATRFWGASFLVKTAMAFGGIRHARKSMAVPSDTARCGMLPMKFTRNSRAHETSQNGLRNDHSALAACRRVQHCFPQRIAYRNRSARTHLDQSVRCRSTARERLDSAYAGGRSAGRGVARIYGLFDEVRSRPPRPAGQNPPARTFWTTAGKT